MLVFKPTYNIEKIAQDVKGTICKNLIDTMARKLIEEVEKEKKIENTVEIAN